MFFGEIVLVVGFIDEIVLLEVVVSCVEEVV